MILFWEGSSCVNLHAGPDLYSVTSLGHSSLIYDRSPYLVYREVIIMSLLQFKEEVFLLKRKGRAAMLILASSAR